MKRSVIKISEKLIEKLLKEAKAQGIPMTKKKAKRIVRAKLGLDGDFYGEKRSRIFEEASRFQNNKF